MSEPLLLWGKRTIHGFVDEIDFVSDSLSLIRLYPLHSDEARVVAFYGALEPDYLFLLPGKFISVRERHTDMLCRRVSQELIGLGLYERVELEGTHKRDVRKRYEEQGV